MGALEGSCDSRPAEWSREQHHAGMYEKSEICAQLTVLPMSGHLSTVTYLHISRSYPEGIWL